jgi:hypothetical protein
MSCVYLTTNLINNKKYIGVDSKDDPNYFGSGIIIRNSIKKHGKENFSKIILEENSDIKYLFKREKYWIEKYKAVESTDFYNISEGGKGGNMLVDEISIQKHKEGSLKSSKTIIKQRKGKTYEEIYGIEKSIIEKEKRKKFGRIKTNNELQKLSNSLKGKIPWNKGLTKETDDRVLKNVTNSTKTINSKDNIKKIYTLKSKDLSISFNGRQDLESYLKNINKSLQWNQKIQINNLIINGSNRDYYLIITKVLK